MITTHVLDIARGAPAAALRVTLERRQGDTWVVLGSADTDANGRVSAFTNAGVDAGTYRLTFETGRYHQSTGVAAFFPEVNVTFNVASGAHYHVPLLLSPFGYSTYRGS